MSDKNKPAGTPAQLPRVPEWADWLLSIGLLCILVGMTLPLFHHNAIYFFSAGVLLQLVGRAASLPAIRKMPMRLRRLCHIEVWATLFFATSVVFMWLKTAGTDWIAFTLAGGALLVYTSIMKPRVAAKELGTKKK